MYYLLDKLFMHVDADMGEKMKNGKKYWDIKSWTHVYELQDKAYLDLENLFEGNEILGKLSNIKSLISSLCLCSLTPIR